MSETTSVGQIGLDLVVNHNQFNKQLSGIQQTAKKAGLVIAAAFGVKKLAGFGKQCLALGSDLQEVQNVVDTTFGGMSSKIDKFAKDSLQNFGLSETMAKRYSGTLGAMAKSFGFSEKEAFKMSTTLTGLAGDIASFYNISQDEAFTKIKSVFTGETESIKELGVVMTQSALDAYALANGFGKTTAAMTEAEKVSLRYAFVQDKLKTAVGDFIRTSNSWANQVRILTVQFDSFKASIGQGLINVLTPVIKVINLLMSKLVALAESFASFTSLFSKNKQTVKGTKAIADGYDAAAKASTNMGSAGEKAANKVGKAAQKAAKKVRFLAGFDQINKVSDSEKGSGSSGSSGGSGGGAGGFSVADTSTKTEPDEPKIKPLPKIYENLAKSIERFKKACSGLSEVLSGGLKWGYENVLKPLGKWTISKLVPKILDVLSGAIRVLTEVIKACAPFAKQLWENFFKPIAKFTGGVIIKFLEMLAEGLNKVADFMSKHRKTISDFVPVLASLFTAFKLGKVVKNIAQNFEFFGGIIKNVFGKSIFGKSAKLIGKLAKGFMALPTPIKIATVVIGAIVAAGILLYKNWDKIKKKLKPFANFFKKTWENIKKGIQKAIDGISDKVEDIKEIPKKVKEWFSEKIEGVEEWFGGIKEGFTNTLSNLKDSVPDMEEVNKTISDKIGEVKAKISGAIETAKDWWSDLKEGISDKIGEIKKTVSAVKDKAFDAVKEAWDAIKDSAVGKTVKMIKDKLWDGIQNVWNSVKDTKVGKTLSAATDRFWNGVMNVWNSVKNHGVLKTLSMETAKLWESTKKAWDSIKNGTALKKIAAEIGKGWESTKRAWASIKNGTALKRIAGKTEKSWDKLKKKWDSIKSRAAKLTAKILGYDAVKKIYGWWNNLKSKVIKLTTKVDKDGFGGGGRKFAKGGILVGNTWRKIEQYATGGIANRGQMFIAREKGPELVGTLGGHTAIMNNDQIVASVSSGVARAVTSAMGKVGQSLYNAVSNLKIVSKLPNSKTVAPPLALSKTQSVSNNNMKLEEMALKAVQMTGGAGNAEVISLLRQILSAILALDLVVSLDGKKISDNTIKRINSITKATGESPILF